MSYVLNSYLLAYLDGQMDRRTDGQTDRISLLDRVCIPCSAVKIDHEQPFNFCMPIPT